MPAIRIRTTEQGDEFVGVDAVYLVREPDASVAEKEPKYRSWLAGGGFGFHSIDTVAHNLYLMGAQEYAELTARGGAPLWVRMESVVNRDDPLSAALDGPAQSILRFGAGPEAPRLAVVETKEELAAKWTAAGLGVPNFLL